MTFQKDVEEQLKTVTEALTGLATRATAAQGAVARQLATLESHRTAATALIQQLEDGLQGHGDGFAQQTSQVEQAVEAMEEAGRTTAESLGEAGETIGAAAEETGTTESSLETALASGGERAGAAAEAVGTVAEELGERVGEASVAVDGAAGALDAALGSLDTAIDAADSVLASAVEGLRGTIEEVVSGLVSTASSSLGRIEATAEEHQETLESAGTLVAEWADALAAATLESLEGEAEEPVNTAIGEVLGALGELDAPLADAVRCGTDSVTRLTEWLTQARALAERGHELGDTAVHIADSVGF